jgi:hypothetical protein
MSVAKKVVKFVEEKENTKNKKMRRAKERNTKYTEKVSKVIEEPPQDPEKEFEEGFKKWKQANKHQAPVQLIKNELHECLLFKPIKDISEEIMEPSVHYKEGEGEGWESDCDGWFD